MDIPNLHYFPLLAADWLSGEATTMMTPAQEGAFIRLLCHSWLSKPTPCSLPNDDVALAKLSRLGRKWLTLGVMVKAQFDPLPDDPTRIRNAKLWLVYCDVAGRHQRRVEAGREGGKAKAAGKQSPSIATAPPALTLTAHSPSALRVRDRLADDDRGAFDGLFSRVPDPDTWAAECGAMLDGMAGHHKATPAQLARAMRDYVANGKSPNIRQFRRYVEGVILEKAAATPTTTAAAAKLWDVMKTYGFTTATRFTFDTLLQRAQADGKIDDPDGFRRTFNRLQRNALRDARTDADALRIIASSLGSSPVEGLAA